MAEDRGGLKYSINVDGNFDSKIDAAIAKLSVLDKSFDKLSKASGTTGGVTGRGASDDVDYQATRRNAKAQQALAIKKAQILQIQKAQNISQRKAADIVGVTSSQAKQLGLNMWDAEQAARQFLFTFRRLVGILAVFTLARQFAQALGAGVREMVNFNKELETAKTGIATIISSVGQIRDENGEIVKGAKAYNIAIKESGRLVNQLRKNAVGSIATFEELTRGFQEAIGPGLAAGLDTDQIVDVSQSLVEGAKTLNVPLNQLGEEIRSLLKGTATRRNTRLALLFGGAEEANEAIRTATEQGRLFEVLQEKLDAVGQGALDASDNFAVLNSDLQDSVSILLAEGGVSLFEELKTAIIGVRSALVETEGENNIVSPDALAVVQQVSDGLAGIVKNLREFGDAGQVGALFYQALVDINAVLSVLAPLALSVFSGIVTGVNTALLPLTVLAKVIGEVSDYLSGSAFGKGFLAVVKYITAGAVGLLLWKKTLLFINGVKGLQVSLTIFAEIAKSVKLTAVWLAAQKTAIFSIKGLTAIWAGLMANVAGATTVATVGASALVAVLAAVLLRSEGVKKALGITTGYTEDAADAADAFKGSISGAAKAQKEGVKTAKEWASVFKDLSNDLAKAEGLKGLSGASAEYASLLYDSLATYKKQTDGLTEQRKAVDGIVAARKKELEQLKARKALLDQAPEESKTTRFVGGPYSGTVPVQQEGAGVADQIKAQEAKLATALKQRKELSEQITEQETLTSKQLDLQVKILNAKYPKELSYVNAVKAEAQASQRLTALLYENANVSVRELANLKAKQAFTKADILQARKARLLAISKAEAAVDEAVAKNKSTATLMALKKEETRLNQQSVYLSREEDALLTNQTRELEKQQAILGGDFTAGLSKGLEEFTKELPALGDQLADIISGSLTDIAGVVADVFKDAIDPRTDVDIKTAFGEFFLDLAGQFVEAMAQQAISDLLVGLGVGGGEEAQQAAQTAALVQNTDALRALSTELSASSVGGVSTGAGGALVPPVASGAEKAPVDTAKSQGIGATIGAAMQAHPVLTGILLPILIGMLSKAFKKGGEVRGYASGGSVGDFTRPSSIPASDTVPAWLTPGEFVIKKDMVKKYGAGMLNSLNNGLLNPGSFAPAAFALGGMAQGIRGYATGGQVSRTAGNTSQKSQGGVRPLPVMVTSEKNANQIFTGGRRALTNNVNKVPIVGDVNAKGMG